jgi:TPR repeat protein
MSEADLEAIILKDSNSAAANDARYILGKLMIEGSFPDRVARNETKGLNFIKTAEKHGHLPALEFKTFYDIRFEKQPSLEKIIRNLETVVEKTKSHRACNTLAEFYHAKFGKDPKEEGNKEAAAKYYAISAE